MVHSQDRILLSYNMVQGRHFYTDVITRIQLKFKKKRQDQKVYIICYPFVKNMLAGGT